MVTKIVGLKVLILPLSIVFLFMFTILFIKPAYDSMTSAKKTVADNTEQIAKLQSQNAKLAELKSRWDTMDEKKIVQVALPEADDIENYMAELYERINRSGVLLNSFGTEKKASSIGMAYVCGENAGSADVLASSAPTATGVPVPSSRSCANSLGVNISVTGNWDQLLGLFKYLEDTNRVANIRSVSISAAAKTSQDQVQSDFLNAKISLNIFYMPKNESISTSAISGLASGQFNTDNLKKIKNVVFSVYEEPTVSESSERNIFK